MLLLELGLKLDLNIYLEDNCAMDLEMGHSKIACDDY